MKRVIYKTVILILCALVFKLHEISAQEFELAGFKFASYPKTSIQDVLQDIQFSFLEYNAFINIPYQLKNKKTVLINGIDYIRVQGTAYNIPNSGATEGEELFHGIGYNFILKHNFTDKWGLLVTLQPTLAGDFETKINEKYFIFLGAAVSQYRLNEFWNIGAGAAYTMRFGNPAAIPLIFIDYKKRRHNLSSLLPTNISYDYSVGNKDKFRIGAQFITNGGQFYMVNTQTLSVPDIEKLTYSRANVGVHVKYRFKGIIQLSAGFGVSNRRLYRFIDVTGESYKFDLEETPFINFGIALVPKTK